MENETLHRHIYHDPENPHQESEETKALKRIFEERGVEFSNLAKEYAGLSNEPISKINWLPQQEILGCKTRIIRQHSVTMFPYKFLFFAHNLSCFEQKRTFEMGSMKNCKKLLTDAMRR